MQACSGINAGLMGQGFQADGGGQTFYPCRHSARSLKTLGVASTVTLWCHTHGLSDQTQSRLLPESQATQAPLPEVSHFAFEPEHQAQAERPVPRCVHRPTATRPPQRAPANRPSDAWWTMFTVAGLSPNTSHSRSTTCDFD